MNPPPPGPVNVLSATHDANPAAMHASTALPPSARIWAPASAVSRCPAAIAPLIAERVVLDPQRRDQASQSRIVLGFLTRSLRPRMRAEQCQDARAARRRGLSGA